MLKKNILSGLALLFFGAASLCATTVQRLSLEDLVKKARHIVAGKVLASRTYWSDNGKLILTSYTIDVDENIKGQSARSIEVTTIGGKIGDVELHVSGMPSFAKGENVVVFTEPSGRYEVVLGMGQGKFAVENGEVSNHVADLSFPDGRPGQALKLPLETFKNQIRTIIVH
jgi:hypothetical protein